MPSEKGSGLQSAIPAIVAVFGMLASGLWLLPDPLGSTRPKAAATRYESVGEQAVEARLWADPFRSVFEYRQQHREGPATTPSEALSSSTANDGPFGQFPLPSSLRSQLIDRPDLNGLGPLDVLRYSIGDLGRSKQPQRLLILPVFVRAAAYAEDAENRLRTRFALLAALNVSGYVPRDGEHIGFFTTPWLTDREVRYDPALDGSIKIDVPYEWFTPDAPYPTTNKTESGKTDRATRILVLWLDDAAFSHRPFVRLAKLIRSLTTDGSAKASVPTRIRVLGPSSSTYLREMLTDPYMQPHVASDDAPLETRDQSLQDLEVFPTVRRRRAKRFPLISPSHWTKI